jgi:integrase
MIAPACPTLRSFYRSTYTVEQLTERRDATKELYEIQLNHLAEYFGGRDPYADEVTGEAIAGAMAKLFARSRSPATCNKFRAHVLALVHHAQLRRVVSRRPITVRKYKQPKATPQAWRLQQLTTLVELARQVPGTIPVLDDAGVRIGEIPAGAFWAALVLVIFDSGLRISATMLLEWTDYDVQAGALRVRAEVQKQLEGQFLDLSPDARSALSAIRAPARRLIFPWPWDRRSQNWPTLNRHYRRILAAAGLPTGRRDLFHRLRRTTASYLKAAGGDARERLGHSSEAVTRVYLDPAISRGTRPSDLLPRPSNRIAPGGVYWPQSTLMSVASTMEGEVDYRPALACNQRRLFE